MALSVNKNVIRIVKKIIQDKDKLKVKIEKTDAGVTIIDAGVETQGGYAAGKYVTEVCMGGLGEASLGLMTFDDLFLPTVTVFTDFPAVALLGAQFAGWRINVGKYFAMGSGPARALGLKPKELYAKIGYRDTANTATIVLETSTKPPPEALEYLVRECKVNAKDLYVIIVPTSSIAGSTQISGRIVETGIHKLTEIGLEPKTIVSGMGSAPIAPVHPKSEKAMGRTNDMILYGGTVFFNVAYDDDDDLKELITESPSLKSRDYGRPFAEIFKDAGYDFYKIDPALFAPAVVTVNNIKTGRCFQAGKINTNVISRSLRS